MVNWNKDNNLACRLYTDDFQKFEPQKLYSKFWVYKLMKTWDKIHSELALGYFMTFQVASQKECSEDHH